MITQSTTEHVILLHGLARTSHSMKKMENALVKAGYSVSNVNYPSRKYKIEKLADDAISTALPDCPSNAKIHFVTHSMGGILVRQFLNTHTIANIGRIVMLGPPNKGSQLVDKLGSWQLFNLINGPAGQQLSTDNQSTPNTLGPANFELGVIAGTRNFLPLFLILPSPNDGKVTVESSKLEGMAAHIELPVTHTFMMNNSLVIEQTLSFLNDGKFNTFTD